jgi:hypothetical protein
VILPKLKATWPVLLSALVLRVSAVMLIRRRRNKA